MIYVIASVRLKAGKKDEFLDVLNANVPKVRAEKGCIEYIPTVDIESGLPPQVMDENVVTIIEQWESQEALRDHLEAPHMVAYKEKVEDMVERVTLKVLREV